MIVLRAEIETVTFEVVKELFVIQIKRRVQQSSTFGKGRRGGDDRTEVGE
jgi:hypothetical protein